jgi:RNA polymerase sigma factor (sigma-70 family)
MASTPLHAIVRRLRHVVRPEGAGELTDARLLERFVADRDEAAFEVLVWRHGPVVLNVCRRLLRQEHDVEDAFQATFLVLVRKAASIGRREALAGWLYRVAYRIALAARVSIARRTAHEKPCLDGCDTAGGGDPADEAIRSELRPFLDAAVNGLPEKYRWPVLLCHLEGKTYEEAAQQLGCPKGTIAIRLARGRALLRKRLGPRAVTLATGALATSLTPSPASAAVPSAWVTATVQNAWRLATGQGSGTPSSRAAVLAEGALWALDADRLKTAALVLAAGILVAGIGLATLRTPAASSPEVAEPAAGQDARPSPPEGKPERQDADGDPLPPGALARLGTLRFRHGQNVADIAFAPDGKSLAAVDSDMLCLWDMATGKELRRLERATAGHGLTFAPAGKSLASADFGAIHIWDPATGQQLRQFPLEGERVQSLTFSPDGKTLAWMTRDNILRLSDATTGKVLHQWPGRPNVVPSSVAFSPDSRTLALACQKDNDFPLYDTATGKELRRFVGHRQSLHAVVFSPDGKTLVSSARDNTLRFWDAATGKELHQAKHDGGVWNLAFSPDGTVLATGGWESRLWDPATGKLLRICERDDDGHIECLAFSPDSKTLAASRNNSHALSFWDVTSGKKRLAFAGHLGLVAGIAIAPDGTLLATAAHEKNYARRNAVQLWDPATGKEVGTVGTDLGFVNGLTFSPDGRLLAAGNEDGTIRLWDPITRREVRRLTGHKSMVEAVTFTADGKLLASLGYHDRTIRLWNVATGKELLQVASSQLVPGGGIVLVPDGKIIVQGGELEPSLVLWDAVTGQPVKRFGNYEGHVTALALAPDGRTLASAGRDGGIRLWDLAGGKEVRRFPDPNVWVGSLVFSPDGRTLACGGEDRTIRLWEVATAQERWRFVGHRGAVRAGAFSPDGRKFFSGSQDTTVLIWDVTGQVAEGSPARLKLSPRELGELQADLTGADASRAHRALWTLVAAPAQAVALFREQLPPVAAADPERMARLLAELDSDDFARREQATKELRKAGAGALPALRMALAGQPSPDLRRRVEQLLEQMDVWSPERMYGLRAVEVLERIGSPDARRVLETLAGGVPEARLMQEAKTSLQRLAGRPVTRP